MSSTEAITSLPIPDTFITKGLSSALGKKKQYVYRKLAEVMCAGILLLPPSVVNAKPAYECDAPCRAYRFVHSRKSRLSNDHFVGIEYWGGNCAVGVLNESAYDNCVVTTSGHRTVRPWR
jgi:hypothetical protein